MNTINLKFKNFIGNILNLSRTELLSKEQIDGLDKELFALLKNSDDDRKCKAKSFFTFNQELDKSRYRPVNQDLNKNYELVFSGCSQTHGDHISPPLVDFGDHNYIWGFQIANKYNKEALNLGMGGWSVEAIHKGLMHHFQENGNPKVLLVLLPDFGRMSFVDNEKVISKNLLNMHELIQHFFIQPWDETEYEKISKAPHHAHKVLPWTQSLYRSLQSILLLDQYCKDNNIYFKYFSWDHNSNIILMLLKKYLSEYKNYSEPDILNVLRLEQVNSQLNIICHEDVKNDYPLKIWHTGIDNAHFGIHHHIHIAEQFMKEIDNDNPWN